MKITDYPYVEITIRAYDTTDRGEGGLLTFVSFLTNVCNGSPSKKLDDNGRPINHIGYIGGGMGSVVISAANNNPDGNYYFQISHKDLWEAIAEAVRSQVKE